MIITRIRDLYSCGDGIIVKIKGRVGIFKCSIGKSVAEFKVYLVVVSVKGLEIAVSYEDILVVVNVVCALAEISCGGIVVIALCHSVGKLSAGVDVADENVSHRKAVVLSGLPSKKNRFYLGEIKQSRGVYDGSHVENHYDILKSCLYKLTESRDLIGGEIVIAHLRLLIRARLRGTSNNEHRYVRILFSLLHILKLCLVASVLRVSLCYLSVDRYLALFLLDLHSREERVAVCALYRARTARSLYSVDRAASYKRYLVVLVKRKKIILVLEKHHSLCGSRARERNKIRILGAAIAGISELVKIYHIVIIVRGAVVAVIRRGLIFAVLLVIRAGSEHRKHHQY